MSVTVREIMDWAEVWALLIPLVFIVWRKKIPSYLRPVMIYVCVAFVLNLASILVWKFKDNWDFHEGDFWWSNNFIYNTHSIIRMLLFAWFFLSMKQHFMHRVKAIAPIIFLVFVVINFTFFEDFFDRRMLSSRLFATEAALLLFYCLQYFIFLLLEDRDTPLKKQPGFWVATGLIIYVATSFFIFLFYTYLIKQYPEFAVSLWDVHNIAYIILCTCIAIAFYETNSG
jgi:hypothetical protein